MNNTFGTHVTLTLFGESHGPEIGCVIDGLRPGLRVEEDFIAQRLALRRPVSGIGTARVEPDPFRIVSGVYRGRSTGTRHTASVQPRASMVWLATWPRFSPVTRALAPFRSATAWAMRIMNRRMISVKYSSGHLSRISVWMWVKGTTSTVIRPQ